MMRRCVTEFDLYRLGRAAAKFDDAQLLHWQKEGVAHLSADAVRELDRRRSSRRESMPNVSCAVRRRRASQR